MLLDRMKVVSFCHVLQGPACTQYLGDMGAQVIKVEPLGGERSRRWAGAEMPGGVSGLYLCAFRNKRLFSVDLKSAEGREVDPVADREGRRGGRELSRRRDGPPRPRL